MTLLSQYYGYDSFRNSEYLKFLVSISSQKVITICSLISRFLLVLAGFILLCSGVLILSLLRGVKFTLTDIKGLTAIFGASLVMLLFFFAIGAFWGTFTKKDNRVLTFTILYIFVALIPVFFIDTFIDSQFSDSREDMNAALLKYKKGIEFENKFQKDKIKPDPQNVDKAKVRIKEFMENPFKQMKEIEKKQRDNILQGINRINRVSLLYPTAFFWHCCNEASSCGYSNFIDFYDYVIAEQEAFIRFWFDRVYLHDSKEIMPFRKPSDYIYHAQSKIPGHYWISLLISLLYSIILFIFSYIRIKHELRPKSICPKAFSDLNIAMKTGKKYTVRTCFPDVSLQLINLFLGYPYVTDWHVSLDDNSIISNEKKNFLYLPSPKYFPGDVRFRSIIKLVQRLTESKNKVLSPFLAQIDEDALNQRFDSIKTDIQNQILLYLAQWLSIPIVIFHELVEFYSEKKSGSLSAIVDQLSNQGITVIEMVSNEGTFIIHDKLFYIHKKNDKYIIIPIPVPEEE